MYPHERSLVKKLAGKPFVLLGVNSDNDREELKAVLKKENITWRSWFDGMGTGSGGPIARRWNINGWPTLYVLDAKGVVQLKTEGSELPRGFDELIEKLVHKASHSELDSK
jgi:hypothetical protein